MNIEVSQGDALRRLLHGKSVELRSFPMGQHYVLGDGRVAIIVDLDAQGRPDSAVIWPSVHEVIEHENAIQADSGHDGEVAFGHVLSKRLPDGRAFVRDYAIFLREAPNVLGLNRWEGSKNDLDQIQNIAYSKGYYLCLSPEVFPYFLALMCDALIKVTGGELRAYFTQGTWEPYIVDEKQGLYRNPWGFLMDWYDNDYGLSLSDFVDIESGSTRNVRDLDVADDVEFRFRVE